MDEERWFTVGGRLIGLWVMIRAVEDFRTLLDIQLGWFEPRHTSGGIYIITAITSTTIGLYLLGWSHRLARFVCCRPELTSAEEESEEEDKASGPGKQA